MTSAAVSWTAPPIWSVPREWSGERCFVLCGGESVNAQRHLIPKLQGRFIAVKESIRLRPDADVLFFAGERPEEIAPHCLPYFKGTYIVVRGRGNPVFPVTAKRVGRTTEHVGLSDDQSLVSGYDSGTSAISLASLFGATEIVVIGMDQRGGRCFKDEIPHFNPYPSERLFQIHMQPLPLIAEDAKRKGIRIVNCSPISRVDCFEKQPLEAFI